LPDGLQSRAARLKLLPQGRRVGDGGVVRVPCHKAVAGLN
jgi:hypothetical protein